MKRAVLALCVLASCVFLAANAEIQITTSKKTYSFGDYLGILITVSNVTGDDAVMHITDENGTKSSSIPIQIKNKMTNITSPNPFDSAIFEEGKYKIEIDYAGQSSQTEFELVDAGNIVMPFASNIVVPKWSSGMISDYAFLKFLADKNVVSLQGRTPSQDAKIPSWYKTNGLWWADKKISDAEFAGGLQYLLDRGVISI